MAITATATKLALSDKGYLLTASQGISDTAGTAESFEFVFPCADEAAHIIVVNGNIGAITAEMVSNSSSNGFIAPQTVVSAGRVCAFSIESGYVKNTDGKVVLKLTPPSDKTLSSCGVKVYALYHGVTAY